MRSRLLLRRLGAILSMVFLLDLGGEAIATRCAAEAMVHGGAGDGVMTAEAMPEAPAGHAMTQEHGAPDACRSPATTSDCATMTTCAALTAVPAPELLSVAEARPTTDAREPVLLQSGPAAAPDTPPPRG